MNGGGHDVSDAMRAIGDAATAFATMSTAASQPFACPAASERGFTAAHSVDLPVQNTALDDVHSAAVLRTLLDDARTAKPVAAALSCTTKNILLSAMADSLIAHASAILQANETDVAAARGTMSDTMLDRLALSETRVHGMADGLRAVAALPDPVGEIDDTHTLPNGLTIKKTRVPMGVIAIIYESRPNVTADAAALCLKSGNVCVLRGGREAIGSNRAIVSALHAALHAHHQPTALISLVTDTSRTSAATLMTARGQIDLLIPRGGAGLIRACVEQATVPCIETGTGICHIYVDATADPAQAVRIVDNAKTSRPSVCNAAEVCLVHAALAPSFLPQLAQSLLARDCPVQLRCDARAYAILAQALPQYAPAQTQAPQDGPPIAYILPACDDDFDTEFLDLRLAIAVVDSVQDAIAHISRHSTGHSEAILTQDEVAAAAFTGAVDSAAVYVNASTRFTDGGAFGLGCEIGISTQKLGARGPMGLREMTSYKYIIHGSGQIR